MASKNGQSHDGKAPWFKGAMALGLAALISKVLGVLQKIPLQNIAGDRAFGIYNAVYPLYILVLYFAAAGFPAVISKWVSETAAQGRTGEARSIFLASSVLLVLTGFLCFFALYFSADEIARWIGDPQTAKAIRSVSFALWFVPLLAAFRGFFQGLNRMTPTAASQVTEQAVRVATMIILLWLFTSRGYSEDWVAAGALFGSVTGAVAGLAVMVVYWGKFEGVIPGTERSVPLAAYWSIAKRLFTYAIPVSIGTAALAVLGLADAFTVPRMLLAQGMGEEKAMELFGIYSRGIPLVQLVGMLANAIALALIPSIANALARKDDHGAREQAVLSLKCTWLLGLAASVGLMLIAEPVNVMLYTNDEGTWVMAVLAWTALFSALQSVSGSILIGLGEFAAPAWNLMAATAAKVALNVGLIPYFGISGAAIATVLAFALAALLNLWTLKKRLTFHFHPERVFYRPLLALAWMAAGVGGVHLLLSGLFAGLDWYGRLAHTVTALAAVAAGVVFFSAAVFRTRCLTPEDFRHAPHLYHLFYSKLEKLKIVARRPHIHEEMKEGH